MPSLARVTILCVLGWAVTSGFELALLRRVPTSALGSASFCRLKLEEEASCDSITETEDPEAAEEADEADDAMNEGKKSLCPDLIFILNRDKNITAVRNNRIERNVAYRTRLPREFLLTVAFLSELETISPSFAVLEASTTSLVLPGDGGLKGAGPDEEPTCSHVFGGGLAAIHKFIYNMKM
ncbi:Peroxisomal membrane protein 13 [Senna tora]|uniref:Peroxisomal membrane protein 13 n=1 Tax=Senna tora TaxID=362788 RepID=A0A834SJG0_9FABA|nr:Peroxisomal membrane protein 13 [Senna tora]